MLLLLSGVMTFAMACSKSDGTKDNRTQSTSVEDSNDEGVQESSETTEETTMYDNADDNTDISEGYLSGIIPDELEYIPQGYENPAEQQGRLEKLTYDTWESFTYEQKTQKLTKEAWVYIPYGYSEDEKYNVFYLSHGGWSNETSLMGTDEAPRVFKNIIDNAIQDGKIKPLIIVLPTYNNTSEEDSGDYSLAIRLTNNFHNELVNDLIPAVESRYSTYAEDTTPEGLKKSRDHRGFGGFSMGSVNTWNTFRYCLDYFRYFMPMSGSYSLDGQYMADLVTEQGYTSKDFFIFAASGTNDFAYSAFKAQIMAMADNSGGMFKLANNEADGNMSFLEREGYSHDGKASDEYTYNGLRFFWSGESDSYDVTQGTQEYRDFVLDNVLHSEPSVRAYNAIHKLYEDEGLSDSEIDELLVLDVKPTSYFTDNGISNQHGYGGYLFVRDENIMGWLFGKVKQNN